MQEEAPLQRFGFGRERRIRRRADFLRVQSTGQRTSTPHFVLLVASQEPAAPQASAPRPPARLGVVVTRKVGNATVRNRIKRVCRECFRLWPDFVPAGIDLVVIARDAAHELGLSAVREEWARARPSLLRRCAAILEGRAEARSTRPRERGAKTRSPTTPNRTKKRPAPKTP